MAVTKTEIFIASRFDEFAQLRSLLSQKINHFPVFPLQAVDLNDGIVDSSPPLGKCLTAVERAEIMILLLGDTYGGTPPGENYSYTHLEYQKAVSEKSKTVVLPFFISKTHKNNKFGGYAQDEKLASWQKEIIEKHTPAFLDSTEDPRILCQTIFDGTYNAVNKIHNNSFLQQVVMPIKYEDIISNNQQAFKTAQLGYEVDDEDLLQTIDLDLLIKTHKIFVDTDSLTMPRSGELFIYDLLPMLKSHGTKIFVSARTVDDLNSRVKNEKNAVYQAAKSAISILKKLQSEERLLDLKDPYQVQGSKFNTADLYKDMFIKYQMLEPLCLITQNEALAQQILKNARSSAIERDVKSVQVLYVSNSGFQKWIPALLQRTGHFTKSSYNVAIESWIAEEFNVIADTSSLMLTKKSDDMVFIGNILFRDKLLPILRNNKNKLIIPSRVLKELNKHCSSSKLALAELANSAKSTINKFKEQNLLIVGEDEEEVMGTSETFADPVFVRLAIRFQGSNNLCFITQDESLAKLLLDNRDSSTGRKYIVTFITQDGRLAMWEGKLANKMTTVAANKQSQYKKITQLVSEKTTASQKRDQPAESNKANVTRNTFNTNNTEQSKKPTQSKSMEAPFRLAEQVCATNLTLISANQIPSVGSAVVAGLTGEFRLTEFIAEGGEGTIFATDIPDKVCKIYFKETLTVARKSKLELMLSKKISIDGVCWPSELVTTTQGEFVGFLMPRAEGRKLRTAFNKPNLNKYFPHWNREHLTSLAITILTAISKLHKYNIFIGDINPENILIKDEKNISIVDADSFQVEGYPCPVGTDTFTSPLRQGQNFTKFLRTKDDELFAVTTLLFMILFPGKPPYSAQGGGEIAENIKNKKFPYVRDNDVRPPEGSWQFIWSHLSPKLKDDFTAVFSRGERVSIDDLIKHLRLAIRDINDGKQTNEIFPSKPWQRQGGTVTAYCASCPPEKAKTEISLFEAEKLKAEGRQFVCKHCRSLKKIARLNETRIVECKLKISPNCLGEFTINADHLDDLKGSNKESWCPSCFKMQREIWNKENSARRANRGYRYGSNRKNNSDCFVATATYQSSIAPEVVFLRSYRDNVLSESFLGNIFIDTYYQVGPLLSIIVKKASVLRVFSKISLDALVKYLIKKHPELYK